MKKVYDSSRVRRKFFSKRRIKTMPCVFLSFFLMCSTTLLTGMCAIFPKKEVLIYDGDEQIGSMHLKNGESVETNLKSYLNSTDREIDEFDDFEINDISKKKCEVKIKRGFKVDVDVFGEKKNVFVKDGQTVSDVLDSLKIEKNATIHTEPKLDAVVENSDEIKIEKQEIKIEDVLVKTVDLPENKVFDLNLEEGETVVEKEGVPRKIKAYSECRYVNGRLVEKKPKEEILEQGGAKTILVGKKKKKKQSVKSKKPVASLPKTTKKTESKKSAKNMTKPNNAANSNVDLNSKKVIFGPSTAYLAKGRTARMGPARRGVVAVNPKVIPYGTKLYIEGYGYCVAGDLCGSACKGKVVVDVCFPTMRECRAWGRRNVKVHVL